MSKLVDKISSFLNRKKDGEKMQRLKDIEVREVSLVDHPATGELFTEVKRNSDLAKKQEEQMDEQKMKEAIAAAIAPLTKGVEDITAALAAQGQKVADLESKLTGEKSIAADLAAVSADVKSLKEGHKELIDEAGKRFDAIETFVTKPRSQKIEGQATDDGKATSKWPSFVRG